MSEKGMTGSNFHYKNNSLFWDNHSLERLALKYGTPAYLYNFEVLRKNVAAMKSAFGGISHLLCYALKANANPVLLREIAGLGMGAEVVSGGELELALRAGFPPEGIIFTGVGKNRLEIESAIRSGILLLSIESLQELDIIEECAARLKKNQSCLIRINPDILIDSHPSIATGHRNAKFGIEERDIESIIRKNARLKRTLIEGIHLHIGSQILDFNPMKEGFRKLLGIAELFVRHGIPVRYLDAGGGLGYDYIRKVSQNPDQNGEQPITPAGWAGIIREIFAGFGGRLIVEPGRSLVASAGILVTRALYTKKIGGNSLVITDAGMNDFMRPALYGAYHEILPVTRRNGKRTTWDVAGPICETGDYFARARELPPVQSGDLLVIRDTGAYGFSLASNYNGRPRAPEIRLDRSDSSIIRQRETLFHDYSIAFSKYSGLGNDFILIDDPLPHCEPEEKSILYRKMCDRRFGIGADGVAELIHNSNGWRVIFYNSDGSRVDMCGNALRCAALHLNRRTPRGSRIIIRTDRGIRSCLVEGTEVSIEIGILKEPEKCIVLAGNRSFDGWLSNTGVPHFVYVSARKPGVYRSFRETARAIRQSAELKPEGANVNFISVTGRNRISGRIFERGVEDETLSSGTGASAAALTAVRYLACEWPVSVEMPGGTFIVTAEKKNMLRLSGPVMEICRGMYSGAFK